MTRESEFRAPARSAPEVRGPWRHRAGWPACLSFVLPRRDRRAAASSLVGATRLGALLLLVGCSEHASALDVGGAGIDLLPGPHLFLDDHLIESGTGVSRVVVPPVRDAGIPNPLVTGPEDGSVQPYFTVLRDSATRRFRIWYDARTDDRDDNASRLAYMESDDGVRWSRPFRVLGLPGTLKYGASVVDLGPSAPDPARRYAIGWNGSGGLWTATSADGFAWRTNHPREVISHSHDISGLGYDPIRRRYIGVLSIALPRQTLLTSSSDLLNWSTPAYVLRPDHRDDPTEFYGMAGFLARGDLLIATARVLRDDLRADSVSAPDALGIGYTVLAWTRDGVRWTWDRQPFLEPTRTATWDGAFAWIGSQVPVGDRVHLYYAGYAKGHKANKFTDRQIGMVTIPRDRYVAREAGAGGGVLRTRPLRLHGSALTLNVDAGHGEARVRLLDEADRPVRGFSLSECTPVRSDELRAPLRCARPLSDLRGRTVRIELHLTRARLYSLDLLP